MAKVVVAVHGVGDARPSELLDELVLGFSTVTRDHDVDYVPSTKYVDGVLVPGRLSRDEALPDLFEANWSDIRRPERTATGVAVHLLRLAFGLPMVRFEWIGGINSGLAHVLSVWVQGVFAWIVYPVLVGLFFCTLQEQPIRLVLANLALLGTGLLVYSKIRGWSRILANCGVFWLVILSLSIIILGIDVACGIWEKGILARKYAYIAAFFYSASQVATVILTILVAVNAVLSRVARTTVNKERQAQDASVYLSYLATLYSPVLILSTLGACLWAVALAVVQNAETTSGTGNFQDILEDAIRYDLAFVELSLALIVGILALVVLIAAAACWWSGNGPIAHRTVGFILWLTPMLLIVPVVGLIATYIEPSFTLPSAMQIKMLNGLDVFDIYSWSAMRIVPWLGLAFTPVAIALDAIGDVLLYILPKSGLESDSGEYGDRIGTRQQCQQRITRVLQTLDQDTNYDEIVVLAHSQGSVILYDLLSDQSLAFQTPISVVSIGSPISTLYATYFGWSMVALPQPWKNLYRRGDYIGGCVECAGSNAEIGEGGHINYWREAKVASELIPRRLHRD